MRFIKLQALLLLLCTHWYAPNAVAMQCSKGQNFQHTFASGANWTFCALLDEHHALELQQLHYKAPGDVSRKVLQHLHLGQVLLHYHNQQTADALVSDNKLGGRALLTLNEQICAGALHKNSEAQPQLCSFVRNTGLLAKYNMRPGLQGQQYQLFSVSEYQGLTLQIQIGLSEDGRIVPSVTLSGRATATTDDTRFGNAVPNPATNQSMLSAQASLLYTWRMAFSMNDDAPNDSVEEFNFKLEPSLGNRRPMQISNITTESLRKKERNLFRGWRIKDVDGSGYYLDPQNSGYGYSDWNNNWAQFDLAITAYNKCERHSRIGIHDDALDNDYECKGSLDDFVDGERLLNRNPVLWYSLTRVLRPTAEDYPVISSMQVDFELIPFDWTPTSPFELVQ